MNDNQKDIAIIERILRGEQSGYRELAQRHKDYAFTIAYKILNHREDAEEVAQDAFMQAFGALASFNREAKFTTWFYRIVFNAAVGFKRKHKVYTEDIESSSEAQWIASYAPPDAVQQTEQRHYLNRALQQLSDDDRVMLTLFYLKEHSLEEIADITGISAETVKVKIHRARKRLADEMKTMLKGEVRSLW
ncbi:MAG: sigma-70 family RNA polymerase sigma factor [Spirosomataceae bacterium]